MRKKQDMVISIDNRSNESEAQQIANQIKTLILTHRFNPKMTDKAYIAEIANVCLDSVERAFNILVQDQMYALNDNETYYVNYQETATVQNQRVISVLDIIKELKQTLTVSILKNKTMVCDDELKKKTSFDEGDTVFYQERVYYGDSFPKAYMRIYFNKTTIPMIEDPIFRNLPYYEILASLENYDNNNKRILKAIKLPNDVSERLNQSHQSLGFQSKEYYETKDNKALIYVEIYMNSNYFIRLKS